MRRAWRWLLRRLGFGAKEQAAPANEDEAWERLERALEALNEAQRRSDAFADEVMGAIEAQQRLETLRPWDRRPQRWQ